MLVHMKPWSLYPNRSPAISQGRITLIAAFADLVHFRSGYSSYELPEIFEAPEDEGENDACRDLVRLNAEILAEQFIMADIGTFARPMNGGEVTPIKSEHWEIDDPLPRFATGAFSHDNWADPTAPLTHRIFVDRQQFDRWLAALKPPGFLSVREVESIVDPQVRAIRSVAASMVCDENGFEDESQDRPAIVADRLGLGPVLLTVKEVAELISQSRSSIYAKMNAGQFPRAIKLGGSARWKKSEVLAWIHEQAAKRGD